MNKKPRGDSKLDALAPSQKEQLAEWLTIENLTYAEARTRVAEQFSVFTTASALQSFYSRFAAPWKYTRAKIEADGFAALMEGQFDAAAIKAAKQLAFSALTEQTPNLRVATALLKVIGDSKKLELKQSELAIAKSALELKVKQHEEKSAAMRASLEKAKSKGGLDSATLQLIEEQLKLL